jgi:hypothetical protein
MLTGGLRAYGLALMGARRCRGEAQAGRGRRLRRVSIRRVRVEFAIVAGVLAAAASLSSSAFAAGGWSAPMNIDGAVQFNSISCPSSSFCAAVDMNGNALTFNGSTWTSPDNIDTTGQGLTSVSCLVSSFCMAVDGAGNAYTWTGGSPSGAVATNISSNGVEAVSCASASFCVATNQWAEMYTGSWARDSTFPNNGEGFGAVSCPSSSFCAAVGQHGDVVSFNGSSWGGPQQIDTSGSPLTSVSCPSSSFCAAVDGAGNAYRFNGSSWSSADSIDPAGLGLTSVSCPSSSFCVAVDGANDALTFNGSSWSAPADIEPGGTGLASVSCASSAFCVAVDDHGNELTYPSSSSGGSGGSGQPPATVPTSGTFGGLTVTVMTPSASACVANGKRLNVSVRVSGQHPRFKFKTAQLFIDRGIKHIRHELRRSHGKLHRVTVTVYRPNATVHHVPATLRIPIASLSAGSHRLTIKLTLAEKLGRRHGVSVARLVHKTLHARFTVC